MAKDIKEKINESGISITFIADKLGVSRNTLYNKIDGRSEFKASEIATLNEVLHLTKKEQQHFFFS